MDLKYNTIGEKYKQDSMDSGKHMNLLQIPQYHDITTKHEQLWPITCQDQLPSCSDINRQLSRSLQNYFLNYI